AWSRSRARRAAPAPRRRPGGRRARRFPAPRGRARRAGRGRPAPAARAPSVRARSRGTRPPRRRGGRPTGRRRRSSGSSYRLGREGRPAHSRRTIDTHSYAASSYHAPTPWAGGGSGRDLPPGGADAGRKPAQDTFSVTILPFSTSAYPVWSFSCQPLSGLRPRVCQRMRRRSATGVTAPGAEAVCRGLGAFELAQRSRREDADARPGGEARCEGVEVACPHGAHELLSHVLPHGTTVAAAGKGVTFTRRCRRPFHAASPSPAPTPAVAPGSRPT